MEKEKATPCGTYCSDGVFIFWGTMNKVFNDETSYRGCFADIRLGFCPRSKDNKR
jgi:hypothetical protein